ncbi:MAG TPA: hypothetical protein VG871_16255 [Vicinamibacterales bacterium]|nr:hypothetical protein [Vicinamibacterales bacterium]
MSDERHTGGAVHRETSDVDLGGVLRFAIGLIVSGVVISGLVAWLYVYFERQAARPSPVQYPLAESSMRRLPPEPRLQSDPRDDLENLRRAEDQVLGTYGWVDRNAGVVRIPIDRAMQLIVERGLPVRSTPEAPK